MRIKISVALFLCTALTVCTLFGCGKTETVPTETVAPTTTEASTTEASTVQGSDAPVFMLEKLPEIGEYVDDIICRRRYSETRTTLTPGEDYGKLIPFVGSFRDYHYVDYETGEWEDETYSVSKYGLMNDKGEIIVDAVYDWYDIENLDNGDYIIRLSATDKDNPESIGRSLYCNSDGSVVREAGSNVYFNFIAYDEGYIISTDRGAVDWENSTGAPKTIVYDTKWNKLFEVDSSVPSTDKCFSDGLFILEIFSDYMNWECETQFVDTNGNIVFENIHPKNSLLNGKVNARNGDGLYGIFDVTKGKWTVQPTFNELYRSDNCYIGKDYWGPTVFDADGKKIKTFYGEYEDCTFETYGDRIYIEEYVRYDEDSGRAYYQFTDLETEEIITCKETGMPVTQHLWDTEFFYCEDGTNTYIVNFDSNTVAVLPGCGVLSKINDNYFRMTEGNWEDETQKYTVFSFRTFEKVWSDTIVNKGDRIQIWGYNESFVLKEYIPEEEYNSEIRQNNRYDLLDVATGKPVLDDLSDYVIFEINGKCYINVSRGSYTYTYAPDMTVLMKVRNENDD